jgi:hypothetical protein
MAKEYDKMTPEELKAALIQSDAEKAKIEENAKKEIAKAKERAAKAKDEANGNVFVTYGDDTYKVVGPAFSLPNSITGGKNKSLNAEDLKNDPDLVEQLIKSESGILVKVEK